MIAVAVAATAMTSTASARRRSERTLAKTPRRDDAERLHYEPVGDPAGRKRFYLRPARMVDSPGQ